MKLNSKTDEVFLDKRERQTLQDTIDLCRGLMRMVPQGTSAHVLVVGVLGDVEKLVKEFDAAE